MYGKNFYEVWVEKHGEEIADEKLSNLKKKHSEWLLVNKQHHEKMILNSHKKPYRKTSIERTIENFLIENNINHKYNFIDKYQYDFILFDYNFIIEAQGDYWHGNPIYYSDTDKALKPLNETQKYKKKLDIIKNNYIKERYKIIYLWETEIKNGKYKEKLWNLLK
jgi:G:T-mismatch repair DNA endonuclease (very short patch repair protein)